MAKSDRESTPGTYCELVLAGDDEVARGLVVGLQIGACAEDPALIGMEEELAEGSLSVHLRELIGGKGRLTHFVVSAGLAARVQSAAPRLEAQARLRVVAVKPIASAGFDLAFHAFTRAQAEAIEALLAALPAAARLEGYAENEKVDADAAGLEAYSPAHEYELKGKGRVVGRVDAVVAARRAMAAQPLLQLARIELVLA